MIRLLALSLWAALAAFPAAAIDIQEVTSPGGIKAWLVEEHSIPFTALEIRFRGGASLDAPGKRGAINLMTGLIEEGAGNMDSEAFAAAREALAAKISFDVDDDALSVSAKFLTENRDKGVDLLRTALNETRFDQDAIDRVRGQVLSIISADAQDPGRVAGNTFSALAFGDHPYGSSPNGTADSLKALTRQDMLDAKARVMARDRVYVAATGDITPAELGKLIDDVFGNLPAKAELMPVAKTEPTGGSQRVIEMGVPQSVAIFGLGAMPRKDPDFMAAFIINHILGGGGFSAKLMEEVREKRGLAYSVYSYVQPDKNTSILVGSVATKNASMSESLDIIRNEMKKMAENGPTEADLDAAKSYLTGSYALRFDTNSKIASQLLGLMQEGFGPDYVENRNKMIEAVTLADAKRVAARLFRPDDLIVTVVGKPEGMKSESPAALRPVAAPTRG